MSLEAMPVDGTRLSMKAPVAACATALLLSAGASASAADVAAGKDIFQHTCGVCHAAEIGVNKVGPSLWNVVGRHVASVPDYNYSEKMRSVGREQSAVWDEKRLDAYLANPRQVLHGVKMFFALPDPTDRVNVIAYLKSLK